jgi:hypothetical protein
MTGGALGAFLGFGGWPPSAGVTLFNVYAGLTGMYYFGETKSVSGLELESAHTLLVGPELGYGIKLWRLLTLRPQIGLGDNQRYVSTIVANHVGPLIPL